MRKRNHFTYKHCGLIRNTSETIERIYIWSRSEKACHSSNSYCGRIMNTNATFLVNNS